MALDRLIPGSGTPGAITGNSFMDAVQEELTGLWDRSCITVTGVSGTNTITGTVTPALTGSPTDGMQFILKPAATNTGAVTFNGANVLDAEGNALTAGALRINNHYLLHFDGALNALVVIGYTPATAIVVGSKLISHVSLTTARGSIDFVHGAVPTDGVGTVVLDSTYDHYELVISGCKPATDDVEAWLRIGTGGGPTYQTANYEYAFRGSVTAAGDVISSSAAQILMSRSSATADVSNNAAGGYNATIRFTDPSQSSRRTHFFATVSYLSSSAHLGMGSVGGLYNVTGAIVAIRFQFETGNISSGKAALYGLTNA